MSFLQATTFLCTTLLLCWCVCGTINPDDLPPSSDNEQLEKKEHLGPVSDVEEYCSIGTGGVDQPTCVELEHIDLPPPEDLGEEEMEDKEGYSQHQAVQKRSKGVLSVFSSAKNFLWNVPKAAFNHVYNASMDTLEQFAEMVRIVFNEESYKMVTGVGTYVINALVTPGVCVCVRVRVCVRV